MTEKVKDLNDLLAKLGLTVSEFLSGFLTGFLNLPENIGLIEELADVAKKRSNLITVHNRVKVPGSIPKRRINVYPSNRITVYPAVNEKIAELIDIQSNQVATALFVQLLRMSLGDAYTTPLDATGRLEWISGEQMRRIANQFNLPFMAVPVNEHWYLMLKPPEVNSSGAFGVHVYDPFNHGMRFLELNWSEQDQANWKKYLNLVISCSDSAARLLERGGYDLTLGMDNPFIHNVKTQRKQLYPNMWDCGAICLFQAVLLAAFNDLSETEFLEFVTNGLPAFEEKFGIDVLTREEVLGEDE